MGGSGNEITTINSFLANMLKSIPSLEHVFKTVAIEIPKYFEDNLNKENSNGKQIMIRYSRRYKYEIRHEIQGILQIYGIYLKNMRKI